MSFIGTLRIHTTLTEAQANTVVMSNKDIIESCSQVRLLD